MATVWLNVQNPPHPLKKKKKNNTLMLISKARHFLNPGRWLATFVRTREKEDTTNPAPFHTNLFSNADDLIKMAFWKQFWFFFFFCVFFIYFLVFFIFLLRTYSHSSGSFFEGKKRKRWKTTESLRCARFAIFTTTDLHESTAITVMATTGHRLESHQRVYTSRPDSQRT